jgi:hypothetical protein
VFDPAPGSEPRLRPIDQQQIDQLYALPPEQFTAARNELAKSLRADGQKSEADTVRGLKRPSVGAWVLNQLARTRPQEVRRLIEAGERLRKIQASGKGDVRALTEAERAAASVLLDRARSLLDEAGRTPTEATLQPVRMTLAAAAADPEAAEQLRQGRLERELEPPAFGGLLAQMSEQAAEGNKHARQRTAKADERRARERELADARARETNARRAAAQSGDHAERLGREWEAAQEKAKAAAADLSTASAKVKSLERRLR